MTYSEIFEKYRSSSIGIRRKSWPTGRFLVSYRYEEMERGRFVDFFIKSVEEEVNTYRPHSSIWVENMKAVDWEVISLSEDYFQKIIALAKSKFKTYRDYLNHPQWMVGAVKGTIL